jgi:hypothetical protein
MAVVAANTVAINKVTASGAAMAIIANSVTAMTEINSRSDAVIAVASSPAAISAVAADSYAWASFQASPFFAANLALVIANLIGVVPSSYPTLNSIIASASALTLVSGSVAAVEALASNAAAMAALAVSPNLGIILSSASAMAVIGPNVGAMTSFLNSSGAWDGLFASSVAKGFIVISTALVDVITGNSALRTYLAAISVTKTATGVPDGNATALQPFGGVPAKLITLTAKEAGIAATSNNYNFGGSVAAGSTALSTLSLTAVATAAHVAGYTDMTWNLQGIGVTAATLPIISYVDMT